MLVFSINSIPTFTQKSQQSPSPKQTMLCHWFQINNIVQVEWFLLTVAFHIQLWHLVFSHYPTNANASAKTNRYLLTKYCTSWFLSITGLCQIHLHVCTCNYSLKLTVCIYDYTVYLYDYNAQAWLRELVFSPLLFSLNYLNSLHDMICTHSM